MGIATVLAGIGCDPQIRGILALGVGVVVLLGSMYLLLLTNVGTRLGFLIAATALWGWLFIMGVVWWLYGTVGMIGDLPTWQVKEVVYPSTQLADLEDAHTLSVDESDLPANAEEFFDLPAEEQTVIADEVEPDLGGWKVLLESNPSFGEAKAAARRALRGRAARRRHPAARLAPRTTCPPTASSGAARTALKDDPSRIDRITHKLSTFLELRHPAHYAVLQIQPALVQETIPGQAPPLPKADESEPVISVIMERDLGAAPPPGRRAGGVVGDHVRPAGQRPAPP